LQLTTHFHLVLSLKMSGAIPILPLVVDGEILPLLHCVMKMYGTLHDTNT